MRRKRDVMEVGYRESTVTYLSDLHHSIQKGD